MRMSVIGCGHLGATHAACMAELGHDVIGVDIDEDKVSLLNSGKGWFYEPDLDPMLAEHIEAGRLRFTTDFTRRPSSRACISSGWPPRDARTAPMTCRSSRGAVLACSAPARRRPDHREVDGFARHRGRPAGDDRRHAPARAGAVEVVWNPEFLREGCAVEDTLRPDRIVVGVGSVAAADTIREIYRPQTDAGIPLIVTDLATSELAKGAANAFLATKISFVNAMADICAATGGDSRRWLFPSALTRGSAGRS